MVEFDQYWTETLSTSVRFPRLKKGFGGKAAIPKKKDWIRIQVLDCDVTVRNGLYKRLEN